MLTAAEAARLLRVSTWTIAAMARDGRLPRVHGIRSLRIPRAAVVALIEGVYDAERGEPIGEAPAEASTPRRGYRRAAQRPLADAAVGGGGAVPGRIGPQTGEVVVRRVTRGSGGAPA